MSDEEEFLQQSVNKLFTEIYNYQIVDNDPTKKDVLKTSLLEKLKEYDNEFYKRYNKVPLSDLPNQFNSQKNYRDVPDQSVIQQNLMKNTFVSDAGNLTRYQRLHKMTTSNPVTQPLNVAQPPPAPERNYEKEFINSTYQFKDHNLNSKIYLSHPSQKVNTMIEERDQYLNELEQNKYQQDLLVLMKQPQIIGEDAQPVIDNHKKKIQMLGGLEDTVGDDIKQFINKLINTAMEKSLNEMQQPHQYGRQYGQTYNPRQQNFNNGQTDSFLKDYQSRVNNSVSVVEKSKQLREQMMKRMSNN